MKAKCLCGSIEIEAAGQSDLEICHCTTCRRWSGGPMFAVHCGADVNISGDTPTRYQSSDWAERGFCAKCGTHLFYHLLPKNEYILPAGLFDGQDFSVSTEIFIDQKPPYYDFSNQTKKLTRQQVFEQYAPKS